MHILIHADYKDVQIAKNTVKTIITDPPYGITSNSWDKNPADFVEFYLNILKPNYTIVSCADIKYSSFLLNKYFDIFSHDLVWKKTIGSGQLNINNQPLRLHELVLVFRNKGYVYNRLKTEGVPYKIKRSIETKDCYGKQREHEVINEGSRDLTSILEVSNPRIKKGHPTQKPVALFEKLAYIYSEDKDIVLDPFSGSGTILDVRNRITIGIEKEEKYYELARDNRKHRIVEEKHCVGINFQDIVSNLSDLKYTIFGPKS